MKLNVVKDEAMGPMLIVSPDEGDQIEGIELGIIYQQIKELFPSMKDAHCWFSKELGGICFVLNRFDCITKKNY